MGLLLLVGLGIIATIWGFPSTGLELAFPIGVTAVMAGHVLCDTSNIMARCSTDMAVSAALAVHLDFAIPFLHFLRILMVPVGQRK